MKAVCVVDTSIFCEILALPGKSSLLADEHRKEFVTKAKSGEALLLPLAVVIECGNHVGQIRNGHARQSAAVAFVKQVTNALAGTAPFTITPLLRLDEWSTMLARFPEWALLYQSGIGDLSIVDVYERQCVLHPHRRVYIWSLDGHLAGYDRRP